MGIQKVLCMFHCCCGDWLGWTISTYVWFANSRADAIQRNYGGSCVQMRLSFSSLAPLFLYFIQWLDCGCCYALPSYLGLFHILICKVKLQYVVLKFGPLIYIFSVQETWVSCIKICYVLFSQVYANGDSSVSTYERRASLREFYGSL